MTFQRHFLSLGQKTMPILWTLQLQELIDSLFCLNQFELEFLSLASERFIAVTPLYLGLEIFERKFQSKRGRHQNPRTENWNGKEMEEESENMIYCGKDRERSGSTQRRNGSRGLGILSIWVQLLGLAWREQEYSHCLVSLALGSTRTVSFLPSLSQKSSLNMGALLTPQEGPLEVTQAIGDECLRWRREKRRKQQEYRTTGLGADRIKG